MLILRRLIIQLRCNSHLSFMTKIIYLSFAPYLVKKQSYMLVKETSRLTNDF